VTHQYHFTSSSIAPEKVDALAEESGYDTRAAYLRALIREDAQRKDMEI
jgi:hypothetical protein